MQWGLVWSTSSTSQPRWQSGNLAFWQFRNSPSRFEFAQTAVVGTYRQPCELDLLRAITLERSPRPVEPILAGLDLFGFIDGELQTSSS